MSQFVVSICLFVVRECMIWTVLFEQKMTKNFFFFGKVYRVAMGNDRSLDFEVSDSGILFLWVNSVESALMNAV